MLYYLENEMNQKQIIQTRNRIIAFIGCTCEDFDCAVGNIDQCKKCENRMKIINDAFKEELGVK